MIETITLRMMFQMLLAAILGMVIGVEREHRRRPAGIRTHMLVALGSALFTILSVEGLSYLGVHNYDPSRIAGQVVVGIGFIGAGLIFFRDDKLQGLTTAAGIWITAAIGMAIGFQCYVLAIFTTLLTIFILWCLRALEAKVPKIPKPNTDDHIDSFSKSNSF